MRVPASVPSGSGWSNLASCAAVVAAPEASPAGPRTNAPSKVSNLGGRDPRAGRGIRQGLPNCGQRVRGLGERHGWRLERQLHDGPGRFDGDVQDLPFRDLDRHRGQQPLPTKVKHGLPRSDQLDHAREEALAGREGQVSACRALAIAAGRGRLAQRWDERHIHGDLVALRPAGLYNTLMRSRILLLLGLAVAAAPVLAASGAEKIGAGVSLATVTPIRQVIDRPADFEGKTVRIEGVVTAVCAHMGCWMALAPADAPTGPTVRLKVDDGSSCSP